MNDESKLPKWAQSELQRLRSDLQRAVERAAAFGGKKKTNIDISPYADLRGEPGPAFLPDSTAIRYTVKGGEVYVRLSKSGLALMGHRMGNNQFVIRPESSNSLVILYAGAAER